MKSSGSSPLPVIIVTGPTASGKSDFVYSVFGRGCEIINADSQAVYRHINIGTAKPEKEILDSIPHHLIDIADPKEQFHAGAFVRMALSAVKAIYERKHVPVISGGTAFYIRNLIYGLSCAPPSDSRIRSSLYAEYREKGLEPLYERLKKVDSKYALKIGSNDTLRILRGLEVFAASGKPLSSFRVPDKKRQEASFFLACMSMHRNELYERINNRVNKMFERGLVDEIRRLLTNGYTFTDPGMKGIGYREFSDMQKGCLTLHDVRELIKRDTRRFAKRQMTFFKSFPEILSFHPEEKERFIHIARGFLEDNLGQGFDLSALSQKNL